MKSRRAGSAAPRKDSREAEEIVQRGPALGTPRARTVTNRAACRAGSDLFSPPQSIGEGAAGGKSLYSTCQFPALLK